MYKKKKISIVVPAYNEENCIHNVINTCPDFVDKIVIIDDKSTDETIKKVKSFKKKDPRIVLIEHEVNQGVGGAIASGYKWSRDNKIDIAVVMAGDGQMDPADMPALMDPVVKGETDYSKGNRLIWKDAYHTIPKVRFFGNSMLSFLTKIASGYWHVSDSQTGYTAINKEALKAIDWDQMYKRYGQPNDLLVTLNIQNFRVTDVPVKPVYNVGEESGIKVRRVIFTIGGLLFRRFWARLFNKYVVRDFNPLVLFYVLGFLLMAISVALLGRIGYAWIDTGDAPPMASIAFMFSVTTMLQCFFFAMWFDMEANKHLK